MAKIFLVPVGNIGEDMLTKLSSNLEEQFLFQFEILPAVSIPTHAYNVVKKQYLASAIIERLKKEKTGDEKYLLGITNVDLYVTSLNFVYGHSEPDEGIALLSYFRLNPGYYGQPENENLLFQRVLKEGTHELGHAMSTKHCFNPQCVMYFSNSIFDTDNKSAFFCADCEKKLKKSAGNA